MSEHCNSDCHQGEKYEMFRLDDYSDGIENWECPVCLAEEILLNVAMLKYPPDGVKPWLDGE